jgi:hypothetical protein
VSPNQVSPKQVSVDEEFLKAAQLVIAERDKLQAVTRAQAEVILEQGKQNDALRALLDVQKIISQEWKTSATIRKDVITLDDKMIAKYDQEVLRLRGERDTARRANKYWALGGVVFGAVVARWASGKN